ncbi:MAG: dicarboxylate/amino acid:cation symporter [Verrucomicrobia bacterium]|nr:dicarboxylate/amino acid:cation symporter [Verrucomicrobiota bacterium]
MSTHKKKQSPWKVFIAIIIGMIVGSYTQQGSTLFGIDLFDFTYPVYSLCGKIFINALTLVVVPLVSSSIITGIARIGNESAFGRLGGKTFGFYLGTSLLAILTGLIFVNLLNPGSMINPESISASVDLQAVQKHLATQEATRFTDILLQIVPSNIIDTFGRGQMLGLIFFSLIFGYCISKIESHTSTILLGFWQGIFQAMIQFTHIIMKFLPLGVFFLVAKVFAEAGFRSLHSLGLFTLAVLMGLAVFMFVVLPLLLKIIAKVRPGRHFKAMGPALITAFSTSSSSATLPITIDCVEKRAGVSNRICSLVIPLGTSINMSGSALYECVAALFVAQAYGIELTLTTQFIVVLLALITSIGVAGVPSASLVAIIAILKAIGLPIEGIGLFIAVDRVLDMCRTTVNVFSDSCCAILVAKSEGEKGVLAKEIVNE